MAMKDPEITKIAGEEKFEKLSPEEKIKACLQFNDDFHAIQKKLGMSFGIPIGVYRFKNQEDADKQMDYYVIKNALKGQKK